MKKTELDAALGKLETGPYIHTRTYQEFLALGEALKSRGFRGAGNTDLRNDPLYREIWNRAGYEVIRTQGFTSSGRAIQDAGSGGIDCVFFFIRPIWSEAA